MICRIITETVFEADSLSEVSKASKKLQDDIEQSLSSMKNDNAITNYSSVIRDKEVQPE